jgi:hypothetical protein
MYSVCLDIYKPTTKKSNISIKNSGNLKQVTLKPVVLNHEASPVALEQFITLGWSHH